MRTREEIENEFTERGRTSGLWKAVVYELLLDIRDLLQAKN